MKRGEMPHYPCFNDPDMAYTYAMFSFRTLGISRPSWLSMSPNIANAEIQGISIYDLEQDDDKAAQTANRLIKANHINYSILYNDFKFHNHCSHVSPLYTWLQSFI